MLGRNQYCRLSLDVISLGEVRRLSLDVINPETCYSSVNMSPGVVRRLLEGNKSRGLSECKRIPGMVHRLLRCNTPEGYMNGKYPGHRLFRCNKS